MYILSVEDNFASAHQLEGYKGECENLHGHNWKIILQVKGEKLNEIGLLIDFNDLKSILRDVTSQLDHKNLNDIEYFRHNNPSSENIAKFISNEVANKLRKSTNNSVLVHSLTVWESETASCTYFSQSAQDFPFKG